MSNTLYPDTVIRTGANAITSMVFFPSTDESSMSGQLLVTGTDAGHVVVWKLCTQSTVQNIDLSASTVLSILPVAQYSAVIAYTRDQMVAVLQWTDQQQKFLVKQVVTPLQSVCPTFCPMDVCVSTQDTHILYLALPSDQSVHLYSMDPKLSAMKEVEGMKACAQAMVTCIKTNLCPASSAVDLLVGTEAGDVCLYKLHNDLALDPSRSCKPLSTLNTHDQEPVLCIDFVPTSKLGVSVGASGRISVWRCENNRLSAHLHMDTPSRGFNDVRLRADAKLFIACAWDGVVRLYSTKTGKCLAILDFHRESVTAVAFDVENHFVTSCKDKSLCLWSLYANNKPVT